MRDDDIDGMGGHLPVRDTTNWRALVLALGGLAGLALAIIAWLVSR